MQPIFESFPGPLLKSGVGPLARYGNYQGTIGRRPEQMYTSSDTRLEWPEDGPLFKSDSNKRQGTKTGPLSESPPGPLLKSGLQHLFRYGTQQTISGRLEQVHLPSDPRLEWAGIWLIICSKIHLFIFIFIYLYSYSSIYIHIHVFIFTFIYLYSYSSIYIHIHAFLYSYSFIYIHIHAFLYSYSSIYIPIHVFIYIHIHLFIFTFIYSYSHSSIYIHIHLFIFISIYLY